MNSITFNSNREWILRKHLKFSRYLRNNHNRYDRDVVAELIMNNPDEGRKLIQYHSIPQKDKLLKLLKFIVHHPQITAAILGDQRYGKDAALNYIFEKAIVYCKENGIEPPRIVTLGNLKCPPFVKREDMYFSFKNIPTGTKEKEVWIYCSEIETVLPSREGKNMENQLFSQLEGTLAQNHQKLFGCLKLASKVDINFIRSLNVKIYKFISPEKLNVENVERENIISDLAMWHLPNNPANKGETLLAFDNQIFVVDLPLPDWWSDEYSEQFHNVEIEKVQEYIEAQFGNGMNLQTLSIAVAQKFRINMTKDEIEQMVEL
jgi:hypothetical protein